MSAALPKKLSYLLQALRPYAPLACVAFCRILVAEYILAFAAWYLSATGLRDRSGMDLGADFLNVYAAGVLVGRGQPALAYDWTLHGQVEQAVAGYPASYLGWHYPPMFLAVAALAALLPYLWAFAVYMAVSFAGYWAVMRRLIPPTKTAFWALAAFPGIFDNLGNGQNGFITAGLFGAGILHLEEKPWLAGLFFGLMSYKPQFFVVIPLLLAAGGYGRVLLASCLSAGAVMLVSWAVFGAETWQAFFASTALTRHIILEQGMTGWQKIQSVFSMSRMWGASVTLAYILQAIISVAALACALWVWRRPATLATRVAAMCAALLLTTPYLLDYDLVILSVPLALLARQGIETGFLRYEIPLLAALWALPLWARTLGTDYITLTPPLLAGLMALALRRAYKKN